MSARVVDIFDAVDRADVGVIQRGKRSCLTIEARSPIRVEHPGGGQHLDCDVATELRVVGPINLAHPARAEF